MVGVFAVTVVNAKNIQGKEVWSYSDTAPEISRQPARTPEFKSAITPPPANILSVSQKSKVKTALKKNKEELVEWKLAKATHTECLLPQHDITYAVKYYHVGVGLSEHKLALVNAIKSRTEDSDVAKCLRGSVKYNVPAHGTVTLDGFDVWTKIDALNMHGLDTVVMDWKVWEAHFWLQAMLKPILVQQSIGISHGDLQLSNMMQEKKSNEITISDYDTIENLKAKEADNKENVF